MGAIVTAAEQASVTLTPPELALTPEVFRRSDGSSRFRPRYSTLYSSSGVMAAEDRLLERARDLSGPAVPTVIIEALTRRKDRGR